MEYELKPGDQVKRKSGGPLMVFDGYEEVINEKMALCSWQADGEHIQERYFAGDIERVEG